MMKRTIDYSLYLVTDRRLAGGRPLGEIILEGIRGGVTVVQLREKDLGTRAFLEQAVALKQLLSEYNIPLIINDRLDIALACGADGVHLGQDDMPCCPARRLVGEKMLIGVSVSTPEEAMEAEAEGADYLGVSPVFATPTKLDTPQPTGLEGLERISRHVRIPLVGIGGINAGNAGRVVRAGAAGVAVVSAIMASDDPRKAARAIRSAMEVTGRTPSV